MPQGAHSGDKEKSFPNCDAVSAPEPRNDCGQPPVRSSPGTHRSSYSGTVNTVHLTDEELEMARHALRLYLRSFGHDEADTVEQIRHVIAKLTDAMPDGEEPRYIA